MARAWKCGFTTLVLAASLLAGGCGEEKSQPITDLNEEQKKQVEELNDQRAKEWGK